ncbi:MAG: class I SAM-dependent methyltransferase [Clostridiales bacterium]|nr:class I SAM-dependent methyltransferase [Clostridiales bacterium]
MLKLSKRMQMIADLVPKNSRIADIGCDHAYLSIYLMQKKIAKSVIAMDVNQGPLKIAKEHIKEAGLETNIQIRLSDGTNELKEGEADTLLIAGMGGRLIVKILDESFCRLKIKSLVLQPQSEISMVRRFLAQQGYEIRKESMVREDGKYYTALFSVKSEDYRFYPVYERYGKSLLESRNPVLKEYLLSQEKKNNQIIQTIKEQGKESHGELLEELYKEMEYIHLALSYFS